MDLLAVDGGLLTPRGIALNEAQDRLFVADTGAADIKVFAAKVFGDVAPIFEINDLGGGPVWDTYYDDASDMLFAAGVAFNGINLYIAEKANSMVLRYDGVLALADANNVAATAMIDVINPESVQLAFTTP